MSGWGLIGWGKGGAWGIASPEGQTGESPSLDLSAFIRATQAGTADLPAEVTAEAPAEADLPASVSPFHGFDLSAALGSIPPEDLAASTTGVPGVDIQAFTLPIPGADLGAIGGGHPPADLQAALAANRPVDLPVFVRGGFSGTADLGATLTKDGFFEHLGAFLRTSQPAMADLPAVMRVIAKDAKDLAAVLQPFREVDLPASIITQRIFDTRAIIYGWVRGEQVDLPAFIRRVDAGELDMPVSPTKAVISTHTSSKLPNLTKVARRFFENRYVFGTTNAGLVLLTLEPVFGVFPDLHAEIFARDFFRENIGGFVRAAIPADRDLPTRMTSVIPFISASKIILDLVPLINMGSELVQVGGFKPLSANLTPVHESSTGTADDAGFITTASSYRFYLGTSRGLFVPPQVTPTIRITTYVNNFPRPDLHATIEGWHATDLGASLSVYPFSELPASIKVLDISRLAHITASIAPFRTADIAASVSAAGGFEHLTAELTTAGEVSDLPAAVIPFVSPLARSVISVSTMPTSDLGALINYGTLVRCATNSLISEIGAYIKTIVTGTPETIQNLAAELNVLRVVEDLTADIISRKRTRVRIIGLTFRSKIRDSERIRGSITPVIPTFADLTAEIAGLLHEVNLPASLTPVRFEPHDDNFTVVETVANLKTGDVKSVLLSFRSQVNFYVYEEVTSAVYATDRGTWAIDLRSLLREDSFFDRSLLNRELVLSSGLQEFYSLDAAIRNAIVLLCERRQDNFPATITARGSIQDLGVQIGIIGGGRIADLPAKLAAVANSPDISASINASMTQFSSFLPVAAIITPSHMEVAENIGADIEGFRETDLTAQLTVV